MSLAFSMSTTDLISVSQYHQMIASGQFAGRNARRLELIRGELREMNPIGPVHSVVVGVLARWMYSAIDESVAEVRVQQPIVIESLASEPEPDLTLVANRPYHAAHPNAADVLLLTARRSCRFEPQLRSKPKVGPSTLKRGSPIAG